MVVIAVKGEFNGDNIQDAIGFEDCDTKELGWPRYVSVEEVIRPL